MKFFTDLCIEKNSNIGITNPISEITKRLDSHKGAWARLIKNQLNQCGYENVKILDKKDDWSNFDAILLEWGMEFKGKFNLFGGLTEETIRNLDRMVSHMDKLVSCDIPFPDIFTFINKRSDWPFSEYEKTEFLYDFHIVQKSNIPYFDRVFQSPSIVFGDSHALGQWKPGYEMSRNDGLTLHGCLERGLHNYFEDYHENVRIILGNIDIRHHIMRQNDPTESINILVRRLADQISELNFESVEIIEPLPIEDESRKLPQTGFYKGEPFWGTWENRENCRWYLSKLLKYYCDYYGWKFTEHPKELYNEKGQLPFSAMEANKSVHLSPRFYTYDLEKGEKRF